MDRFRTFPRYSISLVFNQPSKIVEIPIDPARNGAAEARGQFQGNARDLVRKRRERNDPRGEMIGSTVVGQSPPRQSSLRNAQDHLKRGVILFAVESERGNKMVRVQSSDAFDRGDEFWIILERQPAFIDSGDWRPDHD